MADVVVGVDGSRESLEALKLAAREAHCRSGRLRVVYVFAPVSTHAANEIVAATTAGMWARPASGAETEMLKGVYRRTIAEAQRIHGRAAQQLDEFLEQADDQLRGLAVDATVVADKHPSAALIEASKDADLLVVGSRGLGGFAGLVLGSVSQQCVHHALCPVLVVRPPTRDVHP